MALRFFYLAFCALLGLLIRRRGGVAREAEIVILRHELALLRRAAGRRRDWADRALVAGLAQLLAPERRDRVIVAPETLLRWHREIARRRWRSPQRRPGRPLIDADTRELIVRLAREDPRRGYPADRRRTHEGWISGIGDNGAAYACA